MNCINRTTFILDHSLQARRSACYDHLKKDVVAEDDELLLDSNYEFDLEPCSLWSSFIHASLHYARLSWDLSPVGQTSQVSIHAAPGHESTRNSVVLNTWVPQEQSVEYIASQLRILNLQDSAQEDHETLRDWVGPALQGAIAHILEPVALQPVSIIGGHYSGTVGSIVMVLADLESYDREDQDVNMGSDTTMEGTSEQTNQAWRYRDLDLRGVLEEELYKLHDSMKTSRTCSASVYTVISVDETSLEKALTNLYLIRNRNIELLRLHNVPIGQGGKGASLDIFYRSDHIRAIPRKRPGLETLDESSFILQDTPSNIRAFTELDYGTLPTRCAHLASLSPSTFVTSFFPFARGSVHLLKPLVSETVASMALYDHDGQFFLHCLYTTADPDTFLSETALQLGSKRKPDTYLNSSLVEDFVESIIRPNMIVLGVDLFAQEANSFTEIVPSAVKQKVILQEESEDDGDSNAEDTPNSLEVNMALVHTTSRLDLETRWLVQWEGERMHPILPIHSRQIQKVKSAICRNTVDTVGLTTIQNVLDSLIADARPLVLPGEAPQGTVPPSLQRVRESAQAILADLWMIGQRFKSVSQSHVEARETSLERRAARLIATKITPKGLDHQTVRLTLMPPNRRTTTLNTETPIASPVVDNGDASGDGWNRSKGPRGGVGRGSRGGRFDNNRGGRGSVGRGRGGPGGFRGGHMNSGPGNNIGGTSAGVDDLNFSAFDPSTAGPNGDIMVSMTGKIQPVPYLVTQPSTREELEEAEQEYLAQLGEDGCLLKAYWGPRGAQGSSIATVLNSVTSLDSPSTLSNSNPIPGSAPLRDPLAAIATAAQRKMKKLATKRPRLQDFAGRTPVAENGGHKP
ncbi:hypothetical protein BGZ65_011176 [Modicella reniformis]|uniref:Uncharacterized protein n=1 Tax=Modicella reniformis TaxID=1440133 RepID=A0A9P6MKA1_9FUNG|nr:hypothetical protein BGZ65_011176 [Modicella reniformis]